MLSMGLTAIPRPHGYADQEFPGPSPMTLTEVIPKRSLQFTYRTRAHVTLPPFLGDLWWARLLTSLRRVCCRFPGAACRGCPTFFTCTYAHLHEDGAASGQRRGMPPPPRPLVLQADWAEAPRRYRPGDLLGFTLTLWGEAAAQYEADLTAAAELLGERGLDRQGRRLRLIALEPLTAAPVPPWHAQAVALASGAPAAAPVAEVRLYLLTPLRLEKAGKPLDTGLPFARLWHHLLMRWLQVADAFASAPYYPRMDFKELLELEQARWRPWVARVANSVDQTVWERHQRWSGKRRAPQSLSGLRGPVLYQEVPLPLLPLLYFGVLAHVGKGTAQGLGAYALQVDDQGWLPPFWQPPGPSLAGG